MHMNTFTQYLSSRANESAVDSIITSLMEANVDPINYLYLRLVEETPPGAAAVGAGPADPTQDITALTQAVNMILTKYGKTHPQMTKIATNMQREVQTLPAAAQQDMQQNQQPQQPVPQAQQPVPPPPGAQPPSVAPQANQMSTLPQPTR